MRELNDALAVVYSNKDIEEIYSYFYSPFWQQKYRETQQQSLSVILSRKITVHKRQLRIIHTSHIKICGVILYLLI